MNAAARTLSQGNFFKGDYGVIALWKNNFSSFLLWSLVIASALSVICLRNYERDYTSRIQQLEKKSSQAELEWGQLLLEKSTWIAPVRVEKVAKNYLGMIKPAPKAIIVIKR